MDLSYYSISHWRAEPLRRAANRIKEDVDALEESRDKVQSQTVPSSWHGLSSILATAGRDLLVGQMDAHLEGKRQLQKALGEAAYQVIEIEDLVKVVEAQARFDDFEIDDDGRLLDNKTQPQFDTQLASEKWVTDRASTAIPISEAIRDILHQASAVEAMLTRSIPDEDGTLAPKIAE